MPILTELIVSVVGGVLTAMILALFSRFGKPGGAVLGQTATAARSAPRGRVFGDLVVLIVSVVAGIVIAMIGGRIMIQMGLLPRGLPTRLGLLVLGTVICWMLLSAGRRR